MEKQTFIFYILIIFLIHVLFCYSLLRSFYDTRIIKHPIIYCYAFYVSNNFLPLFSPSAFVIFLPFYLHFCFCFVFFAVLCVGRNILLLVAMYRERNEDEMIINKFQKRTKILFFFSNSTSNARNVLLGWKNVFKWVLGLCILINKKKLKQTT